MMTASRIPRWASLAATVLVVVFVMILVPVFLGRNGPTGDESSGIRGLFPVRKALAAPAPGPAFPSHEASWAAYVDLGQPIDLEVVKSSYSLLSTVTDTYVLGRTFDAPGAIKSGAYLSTIRTYTYVDRDGWIVAYFPKGDVRRGSSVLYWPQATPDITELPVNLNLTLRNMIETLGLNYVDFQDQIGLYNFSYPDATEMMVLAKVRRGQGFEYMNLMIPSTYAIFDSSYSAYGGDNYGTLSVDGTPTPIRGTYFGPDVVTTQWQTLFNPDQLHTLKIEQHDAGPFVAIAFVYLLK